tara:strand:- start:20122 stop:20565 length:444 start_codon:yes stop_codon:yes gene_type:complete
MGLTWHDLLGVPWKLHGSDRAGMDCSTVAEEVLRRSGAVPPATNPFRQVGSAGRRGEMASYFGLLEESFEKLGEDVSRATRAGDLVLAKDDDGVARHLYVLVEPSRGTFLTSSHRHGVIAVRRFAIAAFAERVAGVYRIKRLQEDVL